MPNQITEVTRRAIIDRLTAGGTTWSGRLPEDGFLSRLYDLSKMPSKDSRFRTAAADINQHRVSWHDWEDDWVFYDDRFNLLRCSDADFLRFLAETVHPVVRPSTDDAHALVRAYNEALAADGWCLAEGTPMSGKPVFVAQRIGQRTEVFAEPTGWQKVDRQLQQVRLTLDTGSTEEHFQTVGLVSREVLISVALQVYDPARHPTVDGVAASKTDAKRMLEGIINAELPGDANQEARAHAKAAVNLALALQHKRTADFRTAALCAEATSSVVNILAILSGRRARPF